MTDLTPQLALPEHKALLYELNHRINNEFTSAISAISLAAARSDNPEVKLALTGVTELLHRYVDVHRALQVPDADTLIDAATYLRQLCLSICRSKLDHMRIDLVYVACPLRLESDRCWRLGMIVYELITNAARHAFAAGGGEIRVELLRAGSFVACKVQDNGSRPKYARTGRGLRIVDKLATTLNGRFEQKFASRGSISMLAFPYHGAQQRKTK